MFFFVLFCEVRESSVSETRGRRRGEVLRHNRLPIHHRKGDSGRAVIGLYLNKETKSVLRLNFVYIVKDP